MNFELIDTHCHLDDSKYDQDRESMLQRAADAGVGLSVTIGTTVEDSRWNVAFCKDRKDVLATVGMHPEYAEQYDQARDLPIFEELSKQSSVVAIGEVGIDYHYGQENKEKQETLFRDMIRLSQQRALPLVIHQREAEADTLRILMEEKKDGYKGVFHCYAGSLDTAKRAMDLGFYLAVGGILTFKSADSLRAVIAEVPMERLVLETDAPWLAPQSNRGQRNEPAYMVSVAQQLADLKHLSLEEVAKVTTGNAQVLFGLKQREATA